MNAEILFIDSFKALSEKTYKTGEDKGWNGHNIDHNNGETIALIHSELSEALDYFRKGNPSSTKIPEFSGVEEEFADVIIRIMDAAYYRGLNVAEAVIAKMRYNKTRPFKHGGKLF